MKITKVNNIHAAVVNTGVLYETPTDRYHETISGHVERRAAASRRLYKIFGPFRKETDEIRKMQKQVQDENITEEERQQLTHKIENLKAIIQAARDFEFYNSRKNIALNDRNNINAGFYRPVSVRYLRELHKLKNDYGNHFDIDENYCDEMIAVVKEKIRGTLRKNRVTRGGKKIYIPEVIARIMCAFTEAYNTGKPIGTFLDQYSVTSEMLYTVLAEIRDDYIAAKRIRDIARSIENKNMPIELRDGEIYLSGTYSEIEIKGISDIEDYGKSQLFKELSKNPDGYKKVINRMRKDIIRFLYAVEPEGNERFSEIVSDETRYYVSDEETLKSRLSKEKKQELSKRVLNKVYIRYIGLLNTLARIEEVSDKASEDEASNESVGKVKTYSDIDEVKRNAEDIFMYSYIKDYMNKRFENTYHINVTDLSTESIAAHIMRYFTQYICGKLIDIGKGVYYYATPDDITYGENSEVRIGEVKTRFREEISSFDYERIKAEETLSRNVAVASVFACNNFKESAYVSGSEDMFGTKSCPDNVKLKENAIRDILRFFGGRSNLTYGFEHPEMLDEEMIEQFRYLLYKKRNESFHFISAEVDDTHNLDRVRELFEYDIKSYGRLLVNKYFSNNVPQFYEEDDIVRLIKYLYDTGKSHEAHIPSFKNVLGKNRIAEFLTELGMEDVENKYKDIVFQGTIYYLLKEIYYYGFITIDNGLELFMEELDNIEKEARDTENLLKGKSSHALTDEEKDAKQDCLATLSFCEMVRSIKASSIAEITQFLNHEEDIQNTGVKDGEQRKLRFVKVLQNKVLRGAFKNYFKSISEYEFVLYPDNKQSNTPFEDMNSINVGVYQKLLETEEEDILSWYAIGKFVQSRQLNLLIGVLKGYNAFIKSINTRAQKAGAVSFEEKEISSDVLDILNLCLNTAGNISNNINDYYDDPSEYAEFMSRFVDYSESGRNTFEELSEFARDKNKLYADERNPKIMRGIEIARMYGDADMLSSCVDRITAEDIREYFRMTAELAPLFEKSKQDNFEDQEKILKYAHLKNHIELSNLHSLSEFSNDMWGQLVSISFLRERDFMFYNIGYQYLIRQWGLKNGKYGSNEVKSLKLKSGRVLNIRQSDIGLYQAVAASSFGYDLLRVENGEPKINEKGICSSIGGNVAVGIKSSMYVRMYKGYTSLFSGPIEDFMVSNIRNYVDHFKYKEDTQYVKAAGSVHPSFLRRSISETYGDIFGYFFSYSSKLHKSIPVLYCNVIKKYGIEMAIRVDAKSDIPFVFVYEDEDDKLMEAGFDRVLYGTLKSSRFDVARKLVDNKGYVDDIIVAKQEYVFDDVKYSYPRRSPQYVETLKRILNYRKDDRIVELYIRDRHEGNIEADRELFKPYIGR